LGRRGSARAGMMAITVKPSDHQNAVPKAVGVELGGEDHGQDGGAERAADLLGDPGHGAGVGHLAGGEPEVGGGHDRDGDRAEAGAAYDEAEAEEYLVGVDADLGVGDRADGGEQDAGDHDRAGADAVGERAGLAPGEQHPDALGCQQQAGVERALAAYLLVVERK